MGYKWCAVPACKNTSIKTPEKLFLCVPQHAKIRKKWLQLAHRNPNDISDNSVIFFCEDHFNMEKDISNYCQYKMGFSQRILMVEGVLPSKFHCQQDRRERMCNASTSRPAKRRKTLLIQECENIQPNETLQEVVISEDHMTTGFSITLRTAPSDAGVMDIKIEIKEEDSLSDIDSQNEREFFPKDVSKKSHSDAVLVDADCNMAIKTEIKSEPPFQECLNKHLGEQNESETVRSSNNCRITTETEVLEPILYSDFGSQNEREFLPEDPKKYRSDNEMDNEVKIKQEVLWLETETSSVCNEYIDGDVLAVNSIRSCTEATSGDSSGKSPLLSAEYQDKDVSFCMGKESPEHEHSRNLNSEESFFTEIYSLEKNIHSPHSDKCNEGGKTYNVASYSKKKRINNESNKRHKCQICEKQFSRLSHLKSHNFIHEGKKPHKCEICEKRFFVLSSLKRHTSIHNGKNLNKCEICEKNFTDLSSLKIHMLIHEGKKPHKCEICEKRFGHLSNLKGHLLIHEGKKPYKCDICERRFTHLSHLKRHILIHEGKQPHKCDICEKRFSQLSNLKLHNLIHEGKKPHKCDVCERTFAHLSNLKKHTFIHDEAKKPHKCEICEKKFIRLSHLKRHKYIHGGEKPYSCKTCEKSFTQFSDLKKHYLIHEARKVRVKL